MRLLFAGGGTGGHLFPGVALAQHLLRERPGSAAYFLCTSRPFDARELAAAGLDHEPLAAPRLRDGLALPLAMWRAVRTAGERLRRFRPDVVVGLGGYGAFPAIAAAAAARIPYVLMEQNVLPGRVNRLAARGARRIYAQWSEARRHFAGAGSAFVATGSPLRPGLEELPRDEARRRLGVAGDGPLVGVVGGSQGADSLNRFVVDELRGLAGIRVLHLAGPSAPQVRAAYGAAGVDARVEEYRRDMAAVYGACDLVVSRSGALALAELAALRRAAVLVPFPHAASDHQAENARVVARAGAAALVDERTARPGDLAAWVRKLVQGDPVFDRMRAVISGFARPDAARRILLDLDTWLPRRRAASPIWSASAASA